MCEITEGLTLPLCRNVGGISQVALYNLQNRDSYVISDEGDLISGTTGITMVSGKTAYIVNLEKDLSSFTETEVGNPETGTFYIEQSLNLVINDNRRATRNFIMMLGNSTTIGAIVLDNQGVWRHAGLVAGLSLTAGETTTGVLKGDRNGSNITLTGTEVRLAPDVDSDTVTAITTP
jgi:hypothetical protein